MNSEDTPTILTHMVVYICSITGCFFPCRLRGIDTFMSIGGRVSMLPLEVHVVLPS